MASIGSVHPDPAYDQTKKTLGIPAGYEWDPSWNKWVKADFSSWNYSDSAFPMYSFFDAPAYTPGSAPAAASAPAASQPSFTPGLPTPVQQAGPTAVGAPGTAAMPLGLLAGRNYIGDISSGWGVGDRNRGTGLAQASNLAALQW